MCYGCCDLENNPLLACWPVVACGVPDFLLVTMSWPFCFLYVRIFLLFGAIVSMRVGCYRVYRFHVFVIGCVSCLTGSCLLVLLLYLHVDSKNIYVFVVSFKKTIRNQKQ